MHFDQNVIKIKSEMQATDDQHVCHPSAISVESQIHRHCNAIWRREYARRRAWVCRAELDRPAQRPASHDALRHQGAASFGSMGGSPRQVSSTVQLPKYVHRRTIWFTFRISIEIFREIKCQQKKSPDRNKVGNQKKSAEKPSCPVCPCGRAKWPKKLASHNLHVMYDDIVRVESITARPDARKSGRRPRKFMR